MGPSAKALGSGEGQNEKIRGPLIVWRHSAAGARLPNFRVAAISATGSWPASSPSFGGRHGAILLPKHHCACSRRPDSGERVLGEDGIYTSPNETGRGKQRTHTQHPGSRPEHAEPFQLPRLGHLWKSGRFALGGPPIRPISGISDRFECSVRRDEAATAGQGIWIGDERGF